MKITGPLFSIKAQGSLDKAISYSTRHGKNLARQYTKPTGRATGAQTTQRTTFKGIIDEWNALTAGEKLAWATLAPLARPLSGYNIFLSSTTKKRAVRMFGNAFFSQAVFGGPPSL